MGGSSGMAGRLRPRLSTTSRAAEPQADYRRPRPNRGEIWLADLEPPDKTRPVLIVSRQSIALAAQNLTVAAVTSTIRGLPFEVPIGEIEGTKHASVVNLSNLQTLKILRFRRFLGVVGPATMGAVCRAIAVATGCD